MRRRVHQTSCESSSKKITKGVALLEHARDETSGFRRTIFQSGCGSVTIKTAHGDAEECATSQELLVCLAKAGAEFETDEQDVIDHEGPFTSIPISCDTEDGRADRTKHEH